MEYGSERSFWISLMMSGICSSDSYTTYEIGAVDMSPSAGEAATSVVGQPTSWSFSA